MIIPLGATLEGTEFLWDPSKFPWNWANTNPFLSYLSYHVHSYHCSIIFIKPSSEAKQATVCWFLASNNGVKLSFLYSYFAVATTTKKMDQARVRRALHTLQQDAGGSLF